MAQPAETYERGPDATRRAHAAAWARLDAADGCILVEGVSDEVALASAAVALDVDLARSGIVVVPIGGAQAIATAVRRLTADRPDLRILGLCDLAERSFFERALERDTTFVCDADLEDELLRAAGPDLLRRVIADAGEERSFARLQRQPPWREAAVLDQVHRFIRSRSGRGQRYAIEIIRALAPGAIPAPLSDVIRSAVK